MSEEKPKKGLGARIKRLSLTMSDKATDWLFKEGETTAKGSAEEDGAAGSAITITTTTTAAAEVASPKARRPSRRAPAPPPASDPETAGAGSGRKSSEAAKAAVAAAAEAHAVERAAKARAQADADAAATAAAAAAAEATATTAAAAAAAAVASPSSAAAAAAAAQDGEDADVDADADADAGAGAGEGARGGAAAAQPHYFEAHEPDSTSVEVVLPCASVQASVVGFDRKKGRKPTQNPYQPKSPTTGIITIFLIDVHVKGLPADWEGDGTGTTEADPEGGGGRRSWRVRKRYNDFKELHAACIADHLGDELPLPGKSRGAQTDEMLATRRMALNAYIADLCGRPSLPPHVAIELQHFLGCEDNGFSRGELLWKKAVTV